MPAEELQMEIRAAAVAAAPVQLVQIGTTLLLILVAAEMVCSIRLVEVPLITAVAAVAVLGIQRAESVA
jgi:hypothetical protein